MADEPRPVDVEVGRRLKRRRTILGMSQERLGELLGVTYQQVQKYERGANRIGSSRLYDICRVLDVPVAYFFDEGRAPAPAAPPPAAFPAPPPFRPAAAPEPLRGIADAPAGFAFDAPPPALHAPEPARPVAAPGPAAFDTVEDRETLELVRAFRRIRDPVVRRRLFKLAQALAEAGDPRPS